MSLAFDVITEEEAFCLSFVRLSMWKNGITRARNKNDDIRGNNTLHRTNERMNDKTAKETRESERMSFTARME